MYVNGEFSVNCQNTPVIFNMNIAVFYEIFFFYDKVVDRTPSNLFLANPIIKVKQSVVKAYSYDLTAKNLQMEQA